MSGPEYVLVEDLLQRREYPRGDRGPFGAPPWGGKNRSDPRKRGTPNGCAKRSQFLQRQEWARAGEVAGVPSWGPASNKANLPTRAQMDAGSRSHQRQRHSGRLRQTNPICPAPPGRRARSCGSKRQTKPIPAGRDGREPADRPCRRRRAEACETKPIPGRAARRASTWQKKSYDKSDTQQASAKQSQLVQECQVGSGKCQVNRVQAASPASLPTSDFALGTPAVRNKANLPADRRSRRPAGSAQTKPISGAGRCAGPGMHHCRPAAPQRPSQAQIPCPAGARAYNGVPCKPFVVSP